ncbi:MAG: hypothetical protein NW223_03565 [Hyphomicrobiaceae bacterium]|nr:hypothetical protein [Hyphomicrobiaceae bacterium]
MLGVLCSQHISHERFRRKAVFAAIGRFACTQFGRLTGPGFARYNSRRGAVLEPRDF